MSFIGVLLGLIFAIILVLKGWNGTYALIIGALMGGLMGGGGLEATITAMIRGIQSMSPAIIRVMTAGMLVSSLIYTGAAVRIAETIIEKLGARYIYLALAGAAMFLTSIGIFMDVACITVAPIALATAKKLNISKISVLLALGGGCKAGNFVSPNPPVIAVSEVFGVSIPMVMGNNLIPAILGTLTAAIIAHKCAHKGESVHEAIYTQDIKELPSFISSIAGPLAAIFLLTPFYHPALDPLIALPLGGIVGIIAMNKVQDLSNCARTGLDKISGVVLLLLGIGTVAGVIAESNIKELSILLVEKTNMNPALMAPLSGMAFSSLTGSATAGATMASAAFGSFLMSEGVPPLAAATLISAGAVGLDHAPHGSFFHNSKDSLNLSLKERFMAYHWETIIGLSIPLFASLYVTIKYYLAS